MMIVDDSIVFFLEASFVIVVEDFIVSPTPRVGDRRMDRSDDVS